MNKRMKINTRDLASNPFRDIKNYPFDKEKIENLKNSIEETGFWDNILVRKPAYANYYEIAYGHHRLEALRELFPEGITVEIPVKDLSDSLMLKIMANENMEQWALTPKVIDETVRVTASFLDEHDEEVLTKKPKPAHRLPDGETGYNKSPEAFQIAEFLGSGWSEKRVYNSLKRLQLIDKGAIDKEAVHSMPSGTAADTFAKVAEEEKLSPAQQKKVATEIKKSGNVGKDAMRSTAQNVKYPVRPTPKKKPKKILPTDFDQFLADLAGDVRRVNKGLEKLSKVMNEHGGIVVDKITSVQLTAAMETMYYTAEDILKESKTID